MLSPTSGGTRTNSPLAAPSASLSKEPRSMHVPSSFRRNNQDPRTGVKNIAGTLSCTSVDDRKDRPILVPEEWGNGKGMSDDGRSTL